jgi:hypothetical protein
MITEAFKEMATGKYTIDEWTARAFTSGYRNRSGGNISRSKWHDVFHHRFYLGKTGWGRKGEEQDGNHPALTDPTTFAQVQEVLAKHDHYKKRVQRHDYYSVIWFFLWMLIALPGYCTAPQGVSYYRSKVKVNGARL